MKKIGYLRVSTPEQKTDRQVDALRQLCDKLFIEKASAATMKRPVFERVLRDLKPGDALLILDLDRAFRSLIDAVQTIEDLSQRKISLQIVNLNIDTNTPSGRLVFSLVASIAQFERELASQRTREGLAAAKKRGKRLGRRKALSIEQLRSAATCIQFEGCLVKDVAAEYGVAPWTLTRAIKRDLARFERSTKDHCSNRAK